MKQSDTIGKLATALAKAQGDLEGVSKDKIGQVGNQKFKYADLGGVVEVIQKVAGANGLSYVQHPTSFHHDNGWSVGVETMLIHESGEWIQFDPFFLPLGNQSAQGAGSAISYARRYALSAAFGVIAEDDDGQNAGQVPPQRQQVQQRRTAPQEAALEAKMRDAVDTETGEVEYILHSTNPREAAIGDPKGTATLVARLNGPSMGEIAAACKVVGIKPSELGAMQVDEDGQPLVPMVPFKSPGEMLQFVANYLSADPKATLNSLVAEAASRVAKLKEGIPDA